MFRFRAYLRRNFIQLSCAFTRLTELIIIKTFINIWHLFQPFIVWRNILPLIRKVEWGLQFHKKISKSISILGAFKSLEKKKVSHNDMTSYCHQVIVTDIKMRFSSPLLSVSYSIVLSLPFFFSSLFHWVQKRREKRVVFYLNNCHQSRLFDGGARIIIWWSWVHSTGQQVKLLTRHRKG